MISRVLSNKTNLIFISYTLLEEGNLGDKEVPCLLLKIPRKI